MNSKYKVLKDALFDLIFKSYDGLKNCVKSIDPVIFVFVFNRLRLSLLEIHPTNFSITKLFFLIKNVEWPIQIIKLLDFSKSGNYISAADLFF